MPKKRKLDDEQAGTLLDFFDPRHGASTSSARAECTPKRQKKGELTTSRDSYSKPSAKYHQTSRAGKFPLAQDKAPKQSRTEVIEISDSDEEAPVAPVNESPRRRRSSVEVAQASNGLVELSEGEEDEMQTDIFPATNEAPRPLDFSAFFMESPLRSTKNSSQVNNAVEDDSVISLNGIGNVGNEEFVLSFDRLSPDRWAPEDEDISSETSGVIASEPEEEMLGNATTDPVGSPPSPVHEILEPDRDEVEFIDLSDDEAPTASSSSTKCPVCDLDIRKFGDNDRSRHVNRCLDEGSSRPIEKTANRPIPARPASPSSRRQKQATEKEEKTSAVPSKVPNAFSFLMSRNKEQEAWKEATEAENSKWGNLHPKGKGRSRTLRAKVESDGSERLVEDVVNEIEEDESELKLVKRSSNGDASGSNEARRPAPFYKVMQGMPIAVDAFRYGRIPGVTAYLLTHAHSDHYTNLSSSWKHGPIYCSETTANLVIHMLSVDEKWVYPLPMNKPTVLPDTGGVMVTLIEANHWLQTVNAGDSTFHSAFVGTARIFRYLHCGDFRACPQHVMHPSLQGKRLDLIYLDTTYLDPKRMVIDACAELASRIVQNGGDDGLWDATSSKMKGMVQSWLNSGSNDSENVEKAHGSTEIDSVLVVVGAYTIGKERILKAIARALNTSIWCEPRKRKYFECQASSDPELLEMVSADPLQCKVHVRPLSDITSEGLLGYLEHWKGRWKKVVGFRPTGWTYTPPVGSDMSNLQVIIQRDQKRAFNWAHLKPMRASTPTVMIYGVPSFFELSCFALSISYTRMIATVNVGSAKSRTKMNGWFEKWEAEKKRRERDGKSAAVIHRHEEYW
ncbi:hypothetical protein FRC17_000849 [Serendipita sp. 399]|nr:hypothetical protein FRC17_000849 [Serendipita sp. 399]